MGSVCASCDGSGRSGHAMAIGAEKTWRSSDVHAEFAHYLAISNNLAAADVHMASLAERSLARCAFLLEYHLARDDLNAAIEAGRHFSELQAQDPRRRLQLAALLMLKGTKEALHEIDNDLAKSPSKLSGGQNAVG